jgi:phosphotriesterase-related protein
MKKVITVKGEIRPEELGIVLPHEHLLWDQSAYAEKATNVSDAERYNQPINIENRGDAEHRPFLYKDDLKMTDIDIAIKEAKDFKNLGGSTIVDLTPGSAGKDVEILYKFSKETGLNLIFGTANYIESFWTEAEKKRTAKDIKREITNEFLNGIGSIKAKPGIIGEVGLWSMKNKLEVESLKASAMAQGEIGCALNVHPTLFAGSGEHTRDGNEILDIVEQMGGIIDKTVISHCDLTYYDIDYLASLAKRGAYIEFDQFGMYAMTFTQMPQYYLPSDLHRVDAIKKLIDLGHVENILISHDISYKHLLKTWGGNGYSHILRNIVPMFINYSKITEEQIHTIMVENPKRMLSF